MGRKCRVGEQERVQMNSHMVSTRLGNFGSVQTHFFFPSLPVPRTVACCVALQSRQLPKHPAIVYPILRTHRSFLPYCSSRILLRHPTIRAALIPYPLPWPRSILTLPLADAGDASGEPLLLSEVNHF